MKKSKHRYYNQYVAFRLQYEVMLKWMYCECYGRGVEQWLLQEKIRRIAIYGVGDFGSLLYRKLKGSDVQVDCFVDRYSKALHYGLEEIEIIPPDRLKERKGIDLILISALVSAQEIKQELKELEIEQEIMSLEDVIMRM
jgi:hypothetical protein